MIVIIIDFNVMISCTAITGCKVIAIVTPILGIPEKNTIVLHNSENT
jgi:hypothetical protein